MTTPRCIPLWVKIAYSLFVAILVPFYWVTYTPWNFLYFCDIALLVTAVALWIESPLLVSMQTVAILVPQTLWVADFLLRLIVGSHITGVTKYMFNPGIPLYLRAFSLFHGWLPFVLVWLVARLRYDPRAFPMQSAVGIIVLLISYFFAPAPPAPAEHPNWAVNINYVYGGDDQPQTFMPPLLWLACLIATNLVLFYWPTHVVLRRLFGSHRASLLALSRARN